MSSGTTQQGPGLLHRAVVKTVVVLACTVAAGAAGLAGYVSYTWDRQWDAPLPDIHARTDRQDPPRRIAWYSVRRTARSATPTRRPTARSPVAAGEHPPLGALYTKNLTPDPETGIGRYTDPAIARLLRWSVRPNGRAVLELLMLFGDMSDADLTAIISFLRSQAPVRNLVPENEVTLIGKVVTSLSPVFKPRTAVHPPAEAPAEQPTRERGEDVAPAQRVASLLAARPEQPADQRQAPTRRTKFPWSLLPRTPTHKARSQMRWKRCGVDPPAAKFRKICESRGTPSL